MLNEYWKHFKSGDITAILTLAQDVSPIRVRAANTFLPTI